MDKTNKERLCNIIVDKVDGSSVDKKKRLIIVI